MAHGVVEPELSDDAPQVAQRRQHADTYLGDTAGRTRRATTAARCTVRHVVKALPPGSVISLKNAPETGLWTVISSDVTSYPGPWHQLHMTLLGRSQLTRVETDSVDFAEKWDVVHHA